MPHESSGKFSSNGILCCTLRHNRTGEYNLNTVAIIGRPNVGKSTLFNRLIGERKSIVESTPGVTRDRVYGIIEEDNIPVIIIDTGGFRYADDSFSRMIRKQVDFAIDEADVILLVVDFKEGLHPLDKEIAQKIRKIEKKKALVINKTDSGKNWEATTKFSELVFENVFQVSSIHGHGIRELKNWMMGGFEEGEVVEAKKIGIVGKPNTGKSTFVNAIMGYERSIIKEEPGTTRESINSYLEFEGESIVLVDTAGLKKKSRLKNSVEYYSFLRSIRTIEDSDVILILIDATLEISRQDKRIINWTVERKTPLIILLTKFDMVPGERKKQVVDYFRKVLSFADWIPMIPVSSYTMEGVEYSISHALEILKKLKTEKSKLKKVIMESFEKRHPPGAGNRVKIYDVEQEDNEIYIYTNSPWSFKREYIRYLKNRVRENIDFAGIPIYLNFRKPE